MNFVTCDQMLKLAEGLAKALYCELERFDYQYNETDEKKTKAFVWLHEVGSEPFKTIYQYEIGANLEVRFIGVDC